MRFTHFCTDLCHSLLYAVRVFHLVFLKSQFQYVDTLYSQCRANRVSQTFVRNVDPGQLIACMAWIKVLSIALPCNTVPTSKHTCLCLQRTIHFEINMYNLI